MEVLSRRRTTREREDITTMPILSRSGLLLGAAIALSVLLCVCECRSADPLDIGELNVNVDGNDAGSVEISVFADRVLGSRSSWYPVMNRWEMYTDYGTFVGQHIDRGGTPNGDTIGYAKYSIVIADQEIFVDFRDADYQTEAYSNLDIWIYFKIENNKFYQLFDNDTVWIENGNGVGIWENGRKSSGTPRIPVTVRSFYNGSYAGTVVIDQSAQSSPCQTVWGLGSHTIAAPSIQGGSWVFESWSDGGAQSHSVSASLTNFGSFYTAQYYHDALVSDPPAEDLACYPDPFKPSTTIRFSLPERSVVRVMVYNLLGQEVASVFDGRLGAGVHSLPFDDSHLASGMYFYRMQTNGFIVTRSMLLVE
jgi:hypothetical protein